MDHELIAYLDRRFQEVNERFEAIDRRFEQVDQRFGQIDHRIEGVEASVRRSEVGVESLRGELRLVAEAVMGVQENREAARAEVAQSS